MTMHSVYEPREERGIQRVEVTVMWDTERGAGG